MNSIDQRIIQEAHKAAAANVMTTTDLARGQPPPETPADSSTIGAQLNAIRDEEKYLRECLEGLFSRIAAVRAVPEAKPEPEPPKGFGPGKSHLFCVLSEHRWRLETLRSAVDTVTSQIELEPIRD